MELKAPACRKFRRFCLPGPSEQEIAGELPLELAAAAEEAVTATLEEILAGAEQPAQQAATFRERLPARGAGRVAQSRSRITDPLQRAIQAARKLPEAARRASDLLTDS